MDSYRSWPRFRKDIEAYLRDFFARADEHVKVLFLKEKCFSKAALTKIVHLETVGEILDILGDCYIRPDRYVDEVLTPVRKMRPLDDWDSIGLEGFYATILALCAEARKLGQYSSLANLVVTGVLTNKLPMSELRDYDNYRVGGAGSQFTSELRALEEFVKTCLPGVRRLADCQRCRVSGQGEKLQPQKKSTGCKKGWSQVK